jgi:hypothetical protein
MLGKGSSDSPRVPLGTARSPVAPSGRGGHPLREARSAPAERRKPASSPAPRASSPQTAPTRTASNKTVPLHEQRDAEGAPQSIGRRIVGWVAFMVAIGIMVLAVGAFVVPDTWLWAGTPTEEVTGRLTLVELESKARRGRANWILGRQYRAFVKVAPYSFAFVVSCPGEEACEEQLRRLRPGQQVTMTVDKAAFDELKGKNRTVDKSSRDINRISQNMIAIEMDRRTVPMLRLALNGDVILGSR